MKLWVHALLWLPVVGVCAVSCGDDAKKVVSDAAGGEGGSATQPSSGGSDVVVPSEGGSGGVPAPSGGGVPGTAGMAPTIGGAGSPGDAGGAGGSPGLVCDPVIASGGAGGDPYGGGEWRDWAAGECRACPATPLTCQDLLAQPASYDPVTGVLTLDVAPGVAEIVSASLQANYYYGADSFDEGLFPAVVDENQVTLTLGALAGQELNYLRGEVQGTDGCGDAFSTRAAPGSYDLYIDRVENAGGAPSVSFDITCDND